MIDGHPFVFVMNTDIICEFANIKTNIKTNDYKHSLLREKTERWLNESGLRSALLRDVNLLSICGESDYGVLTNTSCAPLTFDEYRKYAKIIRSNYNKSFWLCTPWSISNEDYACFVSTDGKLSYNVSTVSRGLAPAFVLDEAFLSSIDLSHISTQQLVRELARRELGKE